MVLSMLGRILARAPAVQPTLKPVAQNALCPTRSFLTTMTLGSLSMTNLRDNSWRKEKGVYADARIDQRLKVIIHSESDLVVVTARDTARPVVVVTRVQSLDLVNIFPTPPLSAVRLRFQSCYQRKGRHLCKYHLKHSLFYFTRY